MNVLFILDKGSLNTCETGYAKQYEHFCLLNAWSILTYIYQLTVNASGACCDVAYQMKLTLDPNLLAVWLAIYFSTITSRWNCQCCAVYKIQNDWQLKWVLSTNKEVTRFQVKWVVGKTLIATAPCECFCVECTYLLYENNRGGRMLHTLEMSWSDGINGQW